MAEAGGDLFSNFTHLKNSTTDAKTFLSVKNWDNALLTKLDGDLANTTLKNAIDAKPRLIDSWKLLSNAPDVVRKNIDILDDVTGWPTSWNLNTVGNSVEIVQSSGRKITTITDGKIIAPARTLTQM